MQGYVKKSDVIFENARSVMENIVEAKAGENMVVIADSDCFSYAAVLCQVGREMGVKSIIIDIDHYGGKEKYMQLPIMEPLRQAILHADISLMLTDQMKTDFGRFLGGDATDASLVAGSRRFTFEATGMEAWDLDMDRILADRKRTLALYEWLKKANEIRITTKRGTDITCKVGDAPDGMYPVMGIIPFYAEVAIVPSFNSVNGVVIADGASEFAYGQRGFPIRPAFAGHQELYKETMKLVFKDSMLVDYDGDPVQKARLTKLLADVDPKPDICDEVGLVTTTSIENDMYGWRVDGSHQTHCIHVALGNNRRRGEIIHSDEHVDFDIHEPILTVDGITVYENGVFNDAVIFENAERVKNA